MLNKEKVKKHFSDHKEAYIVGAIGVAGIVVTALIAKHSIDTVTNNVSTSIDGDHNTVINNIITQLVRRGHPGKMVMCDQTGEVAASINRMGEMMNLTPARISEMINGKIDNVKGYTFTYLGDVA